MATYCHTFSFFIFAAASIRAYNAQQPLKMESMKRIDHYVRISRASYNLNRWVGIRIDALGATFTAALASYLLFHRSLNAANTGFSLSMALNFCSSILGLVRTYNNFEIKSNR